MDKLVKIKKITNKNKEQFLDALSEYRLDAYKRFGGPQIPWSKQIAERILASLLFSPLTSVLGAFDKDKIVGAAIFIPSPDLFIGVKYLTGIEMVLHCSQQLPKSQRLEIIKKLLVKTEKNLKKLNYNSILLGVSSKSVKLVDLLNYSGYKESNVMYNKELK